MEAWILAGALAAVGVYFWHRWRLLARAEFIRSYTFPRGLFDKLRAKRPQLDQKQLQLVAHALRQFFLAYLHCGRRNVSMPSQVADDLWHEFILYTRNYDTFCRRAFGGFLHHTPAVALSHERHKRQHNIGLRRVWWHTCREENINPRTPTRLPLLFALDAKLGIADGFIYKPDCSKEKRVADGGGGACGGGSAHCASHFSDTSYDGTTEGFGDFATDGGSGCGGDGGCGGGGGD